MKQKMRLVPAAPTLIIASIIGIAAIMAGCSGSCPIVTNFETEPQWVCPGNDFTANVQFRIENFDESGGHSALPHNQILTQLLDVTKADLSTPGLVANKPGVVPLTSKIGTLNKPGPGIVETPPGGIKVVGVAQAQSFQFALIATCLECTEDGEKYLRNNQKKIETHYGVDLDDDEVMTAYSLIELIRVGAPKQICVQHVEDVSDGWYFVKEEVRGGKGIVIDYVQNPHPFPVNIMPPGQPSKILSAAGQPGDITHDYDGSSPNGKWKIKMPNIIDYDNFIKHNYKYMGKPSICITIGIKCE